MFNKNNFCHVASNNRNEQKAGIFVYKTTDDLQTVLTSGYFNEKIIDINLHDLIIHEWHDPTDRTNVQTNWLCVIERTLDNVGTKLVSQSDLSEYVKIDGSSIMTGPLKFNPACGIKLGPSNDGITVLGWMGSAFHITGSAAYPNSTYTNYDLGTYLNTFRTVYTNSIARYGSTVSIGIPFVGSSNEVFALKSQVDDAANSGEQLYTTGVWYAKMYAATVVPTGVEYNGRNYADFSQVDENNNPIIVIYEGQNGAWAQIATITPPAGHNGYVTVTSKIWDIAEQAGQEGGKVLWSHTNKTFTPYPLIISFNDITVTGNSTVNMPQNPTDNQIVNVKYVHDNAGRGGYDLFDRKWTDYELNNPLWGRADNFAWKDGTEYTEAYNHLESDLNINFVTGWDTTGSTGMTSTVISSVWDGTQFVILDVVGNISTSTDGHTWTTPVSALGNFGWKSLAWNGTLYVAVSGLNGNVGISSDGTTWSVHTYMTDYNWMSVASDGTQFVALSYDGRVSRSTDGQTWTGSSKVQNLGENQWTALIWDGTRFVALSRTGYTATSTDGEHWGIALPTHNLSDALVGDDLWVSITFTGTYYVAVTTNGYITKSLNPTSTWEEPAQSAELIGNSYGVIDTDTNILVLFNRYSGCATHSAVVLTPQTETVAGTTITYYQATDGHKICLDDQESNVEAIYTATGKAWYYIVDTTNHQFKLPRSKKNGYATSLGVYGNGMTLGLTNATLELGLTNSLLNYNHIYAVDNASGTNAGATIASGGNQADNYQALGITTDPTKSGMTTTDIGQDDDQNKFLYFYLGE